MATTMRGADPNQEIVLMYRGGVPRARIAGLMRVPAQAVGYHLRLAAVQDPGLHQAHQSAASRSTLQVTTITPISVCTRSPSL